MRNNNDSIIYSKTPLRISFSGGGSDYPEYFHNFKGSVVGSSINQYIYIVSRPLKNWGKEKFTLSYRKAESVEHVDQIEHPVFREVLSRELSDKRFQFSVLADLPAGTGLGSSSTFTVGLLNLIKFLKEENLTRYDLAKLAIKYEREFLKEHVGVQDQIHASYGGLNKYNFFKNEVSITPINQPSINREILNQSIFLISTGIKRRATNVAKDQVKRTKEKKILSEIKNLTSLVDETISALESSNPSKMLSEMGKILNENWYIKKSLTKKISNEKLDNIHKSILSQGAYGGKLCGAGAGGFFLFVADPGNSKKIQKKFKKQFIDISMENNGSKIILGN